MASRFMALPVGRGESFLLETSHAGRRWAILVDAGELKGLGPAKNPTFKSITEVRPDLDHIDIAICTHIDADHAKGFPDFIATWIASNRAIDELWLPAEWMEVTGEIARDRHNISQRISNGAAVLARHISTAKTQVAKSPALTLAMLEDVVARIPGETAPRRQAAETDDTTGWASSASREERTAASLGISPDEFGSARAMFRDELSGSPTLSAKNSAGKPDRNDPASIHDKLIEVAKEKAELIDSIVQSAISAKIIIRWFDYGLYETSEQPKGGRKDFFVPLSTVEVKPERQKLSDVMLVQKLTITEQNIAALTFMRFETPTEPAVIFVADSRLAFGKNQPSKDYKWPDTYMRPTRPIVYTAAHHGSYYNDRAYVVLEEWLGSDVFQKSFAVRNGGMHKQKLGQYLTVKRRRCARCLQCNKPAWQQAVQIGTESDNWLWPPAMGNPCGKPKKGKSVRV